MVKKIIFRTIKFYQAFISPIFGKNCRFYPNCSSYAILSIEKYGYLKGLPKSILRILKCNQFFKGGIDLP